MYKQLAYVSYIMWAWLHPLHIDFYSWDVHEKAARQSYCIQVALLVCKDIRTCRIVCPGISSI